MQEMQQVVYYERLQISLKQIQQPQLISNQIIIPLPSPIPSLNNNESTKLHSTQFKQSKQKEDQESNNETWFLC